MFKVTEGARDKFKRSYPRKAKQTDMCAFISAAWGEADQGSVWLWKSQFKMAVNWWMNPQALKLFMKKISACILPGK